MLKLLVSFHSCFIRFKLIKDKYLYEERESRENVDSKITAETILLELHQIIDFIVYTGIH